MASPSAETDYDWLRSMFHSGLASDCTLKARGSDKTFKLHRNVLASQSRVLEKMLDPAGAFKENCASGSPVEIGDVTDEVLDAGLGFLYGIKLTESTICFAVDLVEFGHRMEMESLEAAATELVKSILKHPSGQFSDEGERNLEFLYALDNGRRLHLPRTRRVNLYTCAIGYIFLSLGIAVDHRESWIAEELQLYDIRVLLHFLFGKSSQHIQCSGDKYPLGKVALGVDLIYQWAGLSTDAPPSQESEKDLRARASADYLSCPRVADGSLEILFGMLDFETASAADMQFIKRVMKVTGTSSYALGQRLAMNSIALLSNDA